MSAHVTISRRSILAAAALSGGTVVLGGCGASATTAPPAATPTAEAQQAEATQAVAATEPPKEAGTAPVSLQYYYATGGNPAQVNVDVELFAEFTNRNPGVTVEQILAPEGVTTEQKLQTMIAGGVPPDLVYTGASVSFAARGVFVDMQPLMEKAGRSLDDQHPNAIAVYMIKDNSMLWAVPAQLSTYFGVANKNVFAEAGVDIPSEDWSDKDWTWERFLEVVQALTKREGDSTQVWGTSWFDLRRRGPHMFGGAWYDEETGLQCVCDTPEAVKGFTFGHDMVYGSRVCPTPAESETLEGGFLSGKVATAPMGPWSIPTYLTVEDFEWTLFPIPYGAGMDVKAARWNPAYCNSTAISSQTGALDEAWALIEFTTYDDDIYAKWCWEGLGRIPSRVSQQERWLDSAKVQGPNVPWNVMVDAYDYAGVDLDAEQANAQQLLDMIAAEYVDPIQGDPNAIAADLAAAIKPKIQALLQRV